MYKHIPFIHTAVAYTMFLAQQNIRKHKQQREKQQQSF